MNEKDNIKSLHTIFSSSTTVAAAAAVTITTTTAVDVTAAAQNKNKLQQHQKQKKIKSDKKPAAVIVSSISTGDPNSNEKKVPKIFIRIPKRGTESESSKPQMNVIASHTPPAEPKHVPTDQEMKVDNHNINNDVVENTDDELETTEDDDKDEEFVPKTWSLRPRKLVLKTNARGEIVKETQMNNAGSNHNYEKEKEK